MLKEY